MKKSLALLALAATAASAQTPPLQGVTKDEIVWGMHTDLSGPAATWGVSSRNGAQMRIDEENAKGGVFGRKIRLIVEDSQYQVPRAVQAANKLGQMARQANKAHRQGQKCCAGQDQTNHAVDTAARQQAFFEFIPSQ